ncbi:hypothetical protein Pedsa_3467 [Pseudopedobacter saltans DSM 12145]|uniref:Uncharacterized protein n=1 Tax=Pseudopedobacter saltans (strain ATCC 51119 / DSM 12145 / JCM 21818 / CCUG 39354 / LMG 10337 / NBRC 100064 / NCIMB 13643) TaxID=762903 RepID=F0SE78_PSESL|nr:carboxypeptidase-like regulatory domain-containing protein [Pseudopedobacter saltans]ADY54000.1 hypothetical protein Pedsa_3467 [Pseudopedobacter saltans DSM 12145]
MKFLITSLCFILITLGRLHAQTGSDLQKKVSIKVQNEKLKDILSKIESEGNFSFSYDGALLNADSVITCNFQNLAVIEIIDQLFKGNVDYHEVNGFVVLKPAIYRFFIEADEIEAQDRRYSIKGKVIDSKTGLGIRNASVYEKRLLKSTLTDRNGVFNLRFKGEHKSVILTASKENYKDTTMFFLSDVKVRPEGVKGDNEGEGRFGFNNIVENTGFGRFLISSKRRVQSMNIQKFFVNSKVQASFLPGLGSQGFMSSQIVNTFSFNILGGYSAGVKGFESAGIFNLTKEDIGGGFQLAGLLNQTGGDVNGMQVAGIVNLVHGSFDGFQLGGIANKIGSGFNGMQTSGICNHVNRTFRGMQLTGINNYVKRDFTGVQISGIFNKVNGDFRGVQFSGVANKIAGKGKGVQIAGIINISKKLEGLQFGLVNIADSSSGVGIGVINIYKNGYKKLNVYVNETLSQQISFKSGDKKLYSIVEAGTNWKPNKDRIYNIGFGFGHDFILNTKTLLNTELQGTTFFNENFKVLGNSNKLTLGGEREIFKNIGLVAGISYQLYSEDFADNDRKSYPSWANKISENQRAWFGGKLGVVYSL